MIKLTVTELEESLFGSHRIFRYIPLAPLATSNERTRYSSIRNRHMPAKLHYTTRLSV